MDSEIIGSRIKALIMINNTKRKSLAKELGMSYNTLTKKLNGQREFTITEILKIKEVFNLDTEVCGHIFFSSEFFSFSKIDKPLNNIVEDNDSEKEIM